eukprot:Opistho-2@71498
MEALFKHANHTRALLSARLAIHKDNNRMSIGGRRNRPLIRRSSLARHHGRRGQHHGVVLDAGKLIGAVGCMHVARVVHGELLVLGGFLPIKLDCLWAESRGIHHAAQMTAHVAIGALVDLPQPHHLQAHVAHARPQNVHRPKHVTTRRNVKHKKFLGITESKQRFVVRKAGIIGFIFDTDDDLAIDHQSTNLDGAVARDAQVRYKIAYGFVSGKHRRACSLGRPLWCKVRRKVQLGFFVQTLWHTCLQLQLPSLVCKDCDPLHHIRTLLSLRIQRAVHPGVFIFIIFILVVVIVFIWLMLKRIVVRWV